MEPDDPQQAAPSDEQATAPSRMEKPMQRQRLQDRIANPLRTPAGVQRLQRLWDRFRR